MTPARARARRGEGDRLRDEILEAVSALLDETNDEAAVSIRAIADRVGVTPPSIYRHFTDKDDLLSAVCADVFTELQVKVAQAVSAAGTPIDALALAGRCYVEFGLEHPEHYRLVFMRSPIDHVAHGQGEFREAIEAGAIPPSHPVFGGEMLAGSEAFRALYELVTSVVEGLPEDVRPDPFVLTDVFWASVHGITALQISKPDFDWPNVDEMVDTLVLPWRHLAR